MYLLWKRAHPPYSMKRRRNRVSKQNFSYDPIWIRSSHTHVYAEKTRRRSKTNLLLGGHGYGWFAFVPSLVLLVFSKLSTLRGFISVTTSLKRHKINRQTPGSPVALPRPGLAEAPKQPAPIAQGVAFSFPVNPRQAQT